MCGIIGCSWNDREFIKKGLVKIEHRGPDAHGVFFDKDVSLGHRRLSIVDLSARGKQPMANENGSVWIVFNGEIYNHKDLRKFLEKSHNFKSNTDTEALIHLYEEKGEKMLEYLQGMFAFCIYDIKKKKLFLARDRVGIKPLYYAILEKGLIFCSEIKGMLEYYDLKREVNENAISSFLIFRANTTEETMFKGIKKLMPGHFMSYDLKSKKNTIKKYWDIKNEIEEKSNGEYAKELRTLLEDSVRARLMSDVPYGAYLSGGIDSGSIVSLMNKYAEGKVKTFSVGFAEEKDSEASAAKELAEKLGTEHHELIIDRSAIKHLPNIIYQGDEPMADPTAIPTYLLSKYTKQKGVTVVLTGEGSDEIFAGYPQYKFIKGHQAVLEKIPKIIRKAVPFVIRKTPVEILNKGFKFASALGEKGIERFSNYLLSDNPEEQYLQQVSIFNKEEQEELLGEKENIYKRYKKMFGKDRVRSCQLIEFKEPMVDDLLMKVDKNTMAFAVEGRVPFLDYRVVELAFRMPTSLKLRGFSHDKDILRKAMKDIIPKQTRMRKKRHFFVPIDSWLKEELSGLSSELFRKGYMEEQGIFETGYIEKIKKGFNSSRLFYARQLWCLLTFQLWYKKYIENAKFKV
jgi:asparagine synthase (glutamine-hydrolysing)